MFGLSNKSFLKTNLSLQNNFYVRKNSLADR